ncbi:GA module-containing protein [Peptoniphilus rhinitidis]|uniref:GA module-containing protein n=1 Tax=Peptoniphilus rhinitidis TaxID=1175452 RepID=UPI000289A8BB|nr:GA module-containing protein [Peptoniphilus rhinitidis]
MEKEEQYKKIDEWKLKKTFGHGVDSQASNSIKLNYDAQEAYWIFNRLPMPEKDTIFYIRQKNDKGEYARRQEEKTMKVYEKKNMKIEARYEKEKGIINRFNVYFSNVPPNSKISYNYNSSQSAKYEVLADKVGKIRIPFYLDNDPKSVTFSFKNQYYNDYSITIDYPGGLSKERRDAIRKVSNSDRALSYNEKNKYYEQIDNSKTASEINSINNTIDSRKEAFRKSSESEILKNRKEDLISFIEESRFLSNEKKADFKEKVEETSTVTELYSLEDSITKYIFDLTKGKVREEILKLFDYLSKDIDINSISRMYTTKSLEKHLDNVTKASKQALFQFKTEKMELNKKIYDSEFSELEKNKLYSTLNNIETQEELNKFKEELEKQIELLNKDVKLYKEQAKKLIDENKILSKEDKEYYYKRLERAKTNVEVKNIIDEISNGGAEALSVLKDKKAEAKKELDKLELRKNSKEYYIRLIDSAVSLNEVDEVLKLAKSNLDGSKILLEEKEIARNKLKEINNLTEKDNEKFTDDIYYAMEVRELDDILKLANIKTTENLEKSKTLAKMKIYKLTNLSKEYSEKLMKDIDSAKLIEDVNKILKESEELDVKKKLEKDKEELVEKLKDLKYLTNEKLTSYSKDIKEAETYELAKTIYNKAVEGNTKAEELEKEKETYANKLKEKKEEALKIIKGKNLSEYKLNYFTKLIEKASTLEQVETILSNKMLKEDNNSNEGIITQQNQKNLVQTKI